MSVSLISVSLFACYLLFHHHSNINNSLPQDLMQEVSSLQRPANEMALSCNELSNNDSLEKVNVVKIDSDMRNVNQQ